MENDPQFWSLFSHSLKSSSGSWGLIRCYTVYIGSLVTQTHYMFQDFQEESSYCTIFSPGLHMTPHLPEIIQSQYALLLGNKTSPGVRRCSREEKKKKIFNRAKVTSNSSTADPHPALLLRLTVLTGLLTHTGMSLGLWWNFIVPVGPLVLKMHALTTPQGTLDKSMQQTE